MDKQTGILVEQIQERGYEILCDIDSYCSENYITYFLSGGSCLGAVRHHGFIPWDEDIDIMLPRDDYQKLILNFEKAYAGKYKVGSLDTNQKWIRPYTRIWDTQTKLVQTKAKDISMGIFVDVFPIDGVPDRTLNQKLFYGELKFLNTMRNAAVRTDFYDYEKYRVIKKIMGYLAQPIGARNFAIKMNEIGKDHPFKGSKYVGATLAMHYGEKEKIERKYMEQGIRVQFGERKFPIPIGYKHYLTNLYGDYMTIPKDAEEKGYSHLDSWNVELDNSDESRGGVILLFLCILKSVNTFERGCTY